MSRTYGQIQIRFWSSPDIVGLSDQGKLLATYILTGPHSNALGCVRLLPDYVAGDLGWSRHTVLKRLGELSHIGFIRRCEGSGWVLIPAYIKHNPIANANVGKHIMGLIENIPSSFIYINELRASLKEYGNHLPNGYETVLKQYRNREPNPTQPEPNPTRERESFKPPLPGEVEEYGLTLTPPYKADGHKFCNFYESKGWMIGKNKMTSWKAAVQTWKQRDELDQKPGAELPESMKRGK